MNDQIFLTAIYAVFAGLAWYCTTVYEMLKDLSIEQWICFVFIAPATILSIGYFGLPGLLVGLLGVGLVYGAFHLLDTGNQSSGNEQHLRGGQLQDATDHKMLARKKAEIEKQTGRIATTIGGVPITQKDETLNMLFSGSPGSGKTQAFHEVIESVLKRGERAIIFDESGDFVAKHTRGRDLLFNPFDARSIGWSIMNEVKSVENCANLANAMIPEGTNSTENQWNSYARGIIQAVLEAMFKARTRKNSTLFEWVMIKKVSDLKQLCQGTPAQRAFEEGNERMVSSILTIMANSIAPWRDVPDGDFSIRDFVENESKYKGQLLFLASDSNRLKAIAPVYLAMLNLAVVSVNSLQANDNRRLWFFLDELPALGAMNELDALLNRARKRGAAAVIGLQSLKYFDKLFGRDSTPLLLSGIGTSLILRTNDEVSAKDLASQLGKQDVLRAVVSESEGYSGSGTSQNISTNFQTKEGAELVTSTELTRLPSRVGYLKRAGEGRAVLLVHIPICHKKNSFEPFIERETQEQIRAKKHKDFDDKYEANELEMRTKEEALAKAEELERSKAKDIIAKLEPEVQIPYVDQSFGITAAVATVIANSLDQSLADLMAVNDSTLRQPIVIGATVHPSQDYDHHHALSSDNDLEHNVNQNENDGQGSSFYGSPDEDK